MGEERERARERENHDDEYTRRSVQIERSNSRFAAILRARVYTCIYVSVFPRACTRIRDGPRSRRKPNLLQIAST